MHGDPIGQKAGKTFDGCKERARADVSRWIGEAAL